MTAVNTVPSNVKVNGFFLLGATRLMEALDWLDSKGYALVEVRHNAACPSSPTVVIQCEASLAKLVAKGKAAYFGVGRDPHTGGPYREGQFKTPNGVRVVWTERGH
ncbi:hypothetical protein [Pseudogulbenkiania sp. MAI-1]|uniref:hypothetical protein n=1 Tax=Pseudogulbenkiania sp. MAI-1 TaxID=990370 RepID=UPI00045EB534|nr:hypothetical protein [Pseudogulbenkiania sp. MAI-1]